MVGRVLISLVIWIGVLSLIAASFTAVTGPITRANPGELLGMAAVLIIGAALGTAALWTGAGSQEETDEQRGKSKRVRPSRVERLIDDLDDDEVYELEALLLARDEHHQQRH